MTLNGTHDPESGQITRRDARKSARSEAARKAAITCRARKAARDAGASRVVCEPIADADEG